MPQDHLVSGELIEGILCNLFILCHNICNAIRCIIRFVNNNVTSSMMFNEASKLLLLLNICHI